MLMGVRRLWAAGFASFSASLFSDLEMYFIVKPPKCFSVLLSAKRYLATSGSLAAKSLLLWPTIIWESVLLMQRLASSDFSFHRPRRTALFMNLLSSAAHLLIWPSAL